MWVRSSNIGCRAARTVLLLAACVCVVSTFAADEQRLAVVNVSLVFEKYDKVSDIQRRIDGRYKDKKDELTKRAADLGKRNKELEQFFNQENQNEQVFDMLQRLRKDQYRFEKDLTILNKDIQKDYTKDMREVLTDIRVTVRQIAEKGGFNMVLRSPDTDDPETVADNEPVNPAQRDSKTYLELTSPQTVAQLVERFNRNPVLFGAKTVDITKDVLTKLNDDYLKRSITGPGTKAP